MQALRRSAHAMEALLHTVRAEVPDTAATLRLSGMELADCIQEVGALRCVGGLLGLGRGAGGGQLGRRAGSRAQAGESSLELELPAWSGGAAFSGGGLQLEPEGCV